MTIIKNLYKKNEFVKWKETQSLRWFIIICFARSLQLVASFYAESNGCDYLFLRYSCSKFLESSEKKVVQVPKYTQYSETDFALNLTILEFLVFEI